MIGERYDTDKTAGVGTETEDPWYFKAYDGFSRHVATFRDKDASPKEIYTHHEFGQGGGIQLAVRRDVDATGGGGWGGSSDGVLETQAHLLHRANGDVIAVVGGLTVDSGVTRPGLLRERMEFVPGGDGAGSVEPMRLSPSDGYQIGGARGADGLVTGDDYTSFINDFVANTVNSATDLNNNGAVDSRDFEAWNAEFDSGALVGRAVMSVPDGADAKGPGNVRGAMAAAGVALDAVLSGKVSGTKGETGRVRWDGSGALEDRRVPRRAPGTTPEPGDRVIPGTEQVWIRCTPLPMVPTAPGVEKPVHCHVLVCTEYFNSRGIRVVRCVTYSLNPTNENPFSNLPWVIPDFGPVIIQPNHPFDRDNPLPFLPQYWNVNPEPFRLPGVGLCLSQAQRATWQLPPRRYDPFNCNSNWFALSLFQCCFGFSPQLPAEAWGATRCCRPRREFDADGRPRPQRERFACPRGAPGADFSYYSDCVVTEL